MSSLAINCTKHKHKREQDNGDSSDNLFFMLMLLPNVRKRLGN